MRIALVSAIREELHALLRAVHDDRAGRIAGRDFAHGRLGPVAMLLVLAGIGKVATGAESAALPAALAAALAVEMEGAAATQVCTDFERPCAVLRSISVRDDGSAGTDFGRFVVRVCAGLTHDIVPSALA